jgi:hypothetical protein
VKSGKYFKSKYMVDKNPKLTTSLQVDMVRGSEDLLLVSHLQQQQREKQKDSGQHTQEGSQHRLLSYSCRLYIVDKTRGVNMEGIPHLLNSLPHIFRSTRGIPILSGLQRNQDS